LSGIEVVEDAKERVKKLRVKSKELTVKREKNERKKEDGKVNIPCLLLFHGEGGSIAYFKIFFGF